MQMLNTLRATKNKTILSTSFARQSGLGTDMHSRQGAGTINMYKAFHPRYEKEKKAEAKIS